MLWVLLPKAGHEWIVFCDYFRGKAKKASFFSKHCGTMSSRVGPRVMQQDRQAGHGANDDCASLDFDRIVNSYSIHTTRARVNRQHKKKLKQRAACKEEHKQQTTQPRTFFPSNDDESDSTTISSGSSSSSSDSEDEDDTEATPLLDSDNHKRRKRGKHRRQDTFAAIQSALATGSDHTPFAPIITSGQKNSYTVDNNDVPPKSNDDNERFSSSNISTCITVGQGGEEPSGISAMTSTTGFDYGAALEAPQKQQQQRKSDEYKKKKKRRKNIPTTAFDGTNLTRWLFTVLIGLLVGLCTVMIVYFSEKLGSLRSDHVNHSLSLIYKTYFPSTTNGAETTTAEELMTSSSSTQESLDFLSFFFQPTRNNNRFSFLWDFSWLFVRFVSFNMLLAVLSALMTVFLAPGAGGSGIPEVTAYLNGVRVRSFANLKLFLVKIVGTIFSVSSGLAIGPEGPLVHLGAVLGSALTKTGWIEQRIRQFGTHHPTASGCLGCYPEKHVVVVDDDDDAVVGCCWKSSFVSNLVHYLSFFRNDGNRRDFISIGSAAGFAAAFGAPIGGVLYMIEETSSFFAKNLLWKTLSATSIATFCIAVYHGGLSRFSVLTLSIEEDVVDEEEDPDHFVVFDVMVYVSIGVFGGLLGALYNSIIHRTNSRRKKYFTNPTVSDTAKAVWRLSEVALLSFVTSTVVFFLPLLSQSWACREEHLVRQNEEDRSGDEYGGFACADATRKNELGTIMIGSRDEAIFDILSKTSSYDPRTLIVVAVTFFTLQVLTQGVSLPSGIFMPTILVGSSFGGWAGLLLRNTFRFNVSPSVIALLGAAALLAGIQRTTVSLCVILMEGTGQTRLLIPIIITIVTATYVGNLFNHGIYEVLIHLKHYAVLNHSMKNLSLFDIFMTKDIMTSPVITLETIERAGDIEKILFNTSHNGFPVVKAGENGSGSKKFVGLVRRDQLLALLECSIFMDRSSSTTSKKTSFKRLDDVSLRSITETTVAMTETAANETTRTNDSDGDTLRNLAGILDSYDDGLQSNALHIRDDRFSISGFQLNNPPKSHRKMERSNSVLMFLEDSVSDVPFGSVSVANDEFEWLNDNIILSGGSNEVLTLGLDETLPMVPASNTTKTKKKKKKDRRAHFQRQQSTIKKQSSAELWNKDGTLVITLPNEDRDKLVNIQAVMNRGAYSVHEGSPLSSTLHLFTKIGLRHLTVLGGETGGEVVGMITRKNLTTEQLEERTGYVLH